MRLPHARRYGRMAIRSCHFGPISGCERGCSDQLPRKVNSACEHAGASAPRARGRAGCRRVSDSSVARAAAYLTCSGGITWHRVASCRLMMHVCRRRCRLSMGDGAAAGTRAASKSLRVLDVCAWGAYSVCDCRMLGVMTKCRSKACARCHFGPSQAAAECLVLLPWKAAKDVSRSHSFTYGKG